MVDGLTDDDGMVNGLVVGVFFVGLVPVRLLSFVGMNEDDGMTEDDGIADSLTDGTEVKVFFEGMTEDDGMTEDVGFFVGLVVGVSVFFVDFGMTGMTEGMTEDDGMIDGIADGMNDGVNVPSTINNLSVLDPKLPSTYTTGSTASPTLIP